MAGESPGRSEQRKSSGATTEAESGRDPRLAVFGTASEGDGPGAGGGGGRDGRDGRESGDGGDAEAGRREPGDGAPGATVPSDGAVGAAEASGEAGAEVTGEAAAKDGAPEDAAPESAAPEDGEPGGSASEAGAPSGGAPEDSAPEDSAPEDSAPEDGAAAGTGGAGTTGAGTGSGQRAAEAGDGRLRDAVAAWVATGGGERAATPETASEAAPVDEHADASAGPATGTAEGGTAEEDAAGRADLVTAAFGGLRAARAESSERDGSARAGAPAGGSGDRGTLVFGSPVREGEEREPAEPSEKSAAAGRSEPSEPSTGKGTGAADAVDEADAVDPGKKPAPEEARRDGRAAEPLAKANAEANAEANAKVNAEDRASAKTDEPAPDAESASPGAADSKAGKSGAGRGSARSGANEDRVGGDSGADGAVSAAAGGAARTGKPVDQPTAVFRVRQPGKPGDSEPAAETGGKGAAEPGDGKPAARSTGGTKTAGAAKTASAKAVAGQPETGEPGGGEPRTEKPGTGTPEAGTPEAGTPEAGTPEAGTPDAGKSEAAKAGADAPGSGKATAGKSEPGESGPGRSESGMADAGKPGPGKPKPGNSEPGKPGSGKADADEAESGKAESRKPEPGKPEPGKPGAAGTAAGRTSTFVPLQSSDTAPRTPPPSKTAAPGPSWAARPETARADSASGGAARTGSGVAAGAAVAPAPAGESEVERTKQQPLPPLDLLAQLTNTPPPPETPLRTLVRRVKIWTPLVLLLLIVFAIAQSIRPLPEPELRLTAASEYAFKGEKPSLPWPDEGQAYVEIDGLGSLGSSGEEKPVPIASVAKVMTAYVFLREYPLKKGDEGVKMKVDAQAVKDYETGKADSESVVRLTEGQMLSEYEALEALMLPSANNVARLMARWYEKENGGDFVAAMNDAAKDLGMKNTTFTDPSGLEKSTVSTARDLVKLGKAAMAIPVFKEISARPYYIDSNDDKQLNYNRLIPYTGIGIKTGTSTAAGGNLLFAAEQPIAGTTQLIVGAALGQYKVPAIDSVTEVSKQLIESAQAVLTDAKVVEKGQVVGHVDDGLGGRTPVVATKDVTAVGWPGLTVELALGDGGEAVPHEAEAGTEVGLLTVGSGPGQVKVPVALERVKEEPGFGSKLTRIL